MNFSNAFNVESLVLLLILAAGIPILALLHCLIAWKYSGSFDIKNLMKHVKGKHCLVTGASKGLGKDVAVLLVQAGANVTICARGKVVDGQNLLVNLKSELLAINPSAKVHICAVDLSIYPNVLSAFTEMLKIMGRVDWAICNAGVAIPMFFADSIPKDSTGSDELMTNVNYMANVNATRALIALSKQHSAESTMTISGVPIPHNLPERLLYVGSVASLVTFIGFSGYAPGKFAIRGFADSMRSELKPLGIKVHLYMPGNMDSPGFESENKTKPEITKQIEGSSTLVSPKDAAQFMLASMLSGRYYISNDILGELARISVNGGAPRPNIISEVQLSNKALVSPLLALIFTLWSNITDSEIGQYFEKNNAAKKNE